MIKIITALDNPKINNELKNDKNIEIIGKNIFYKEGILEIIEREKIINYIIIDYNLPGELTLEEIIRKINKNNKKIKIIILLKKENKINLKNIKKIYYEKNIDINEIKKYIFYKKYKNKIDDKINDKVNNKINNKIYKKIYNKIFFYIFKKIKNKIKNKMNNSINNKILKLEIVKNLKNINNETKIINFIGNQKVGKTMTIFIISNILRKKFKILIIETDKLKNDLYELFKNRKNIDIIKYKDLKISNKEKIIKKYNYILIENYIINYKIKNINLFNDTKNINNILIIRPNYLEIKEGFKIIRNNKIENLQILINNYNKYSISEKIIKNIFKKIKIIGKIKYNEKKEKIINNIIESNKKIPDKKKKYKKKKKKKIKNIKKKKKNIIKVVRKKDDK